MRQWKPRRRRTNCVGRLPFDQPDPEAIRRGRALAQGHADCVGQGTHDEQMAAGCRGPISEGSHEIAWEAHGGQGDRARWGLSGSEDPGSHAGSMSSCLTSCSTVPSSCTCRSTRRPMVPTKVTTPTRRSSSRASGRMACLLSMWRRRHPVGLWTTAQANGITKPQTTRATSLVIEYEIVVK